MFDNLIFSAKRGQEKSRWKYFVASSVGWFTLFVAALVISVFTVNASLNEQFDVLTRLTPMRPPAPLGRPPVQKNTIRPSVNKARQEFASIKEPPKSIPPPSTAQPPIYSNSIGNDFKGVPGPQGDPNGDPNGVPGVPVATIPSHEPPPPPPPVKHPDPPKPVPTPVPPKTRVSGGVMTGAATRRVEPVYPPLAKNARVQGMVVVQIVIDERGNVLSAQATSGHPLLKEAAVAAAMGWKFVPTKLSGEPVQVVGTITFNFVL